MAHRTAVIHIGTEKTGTTTIQHFLRDNRAALREQGIHVPLCLGPSSHVYLAAMVEMGDWVTTNKIANYTGMDPAAQARKKQELDRELRELPDAIHTVAFSNEHLHRRLVSEREVEHLRQTLAPHFDRFKIVVYFRRQDRLAASLYSTHIKYGNTWRLPIFPGPAMQNNHYYNYRVILEKYHSVFGRENVVARIFEQPRLVNRDLLADYAAIAKIDLGRTEIPRIKNRSLSAPALVVLSALNDAAPQKGDALIRDNFVHMLENNFYTSKQIAPRREAIAFYEMFRDSNRWVRDQHFPDLPESLFDEDFSAYPDIESREQPTAEQLLEVFVGLWKAQGQQRRGMARRIEALTEALTRAGVPVPPPARPDPPAGRAPAREKIAG